MGQTAGKPTITYAEHLAFEATSDVRHEYIHREIYAMTSMWPSRRSAGGSGRYGSFVVLRTPPEPPMSLADETLMMIYAARMAVEVGSDRLQSGDGSPPGLSKHNRRERCT